MRPNRPAAPRPNLEQVAARAGVSRSTVSRVVNGFASVDPVLRARVEHAVAELGYVPNQAARSLVTRRTDTIALVASEPDQRVFGDPFFGDVVRGVSQEAMAFGLQITLLMAQSHRDLDRIAGYLTTAPVDGVLLVSGHAGPDPLPAAMVAAGIPVVIGGRPLQAGLDVPSVDNDNVGGGTAAAQHLAGLGRRAVGTVAGPADMAAGIDRLAGFRAGLGRAYRSAHVERGDFTVDGGEAATARLLERLPELDGLFAANDLMAMGALKALRRAGRQVPDDVALVGFDDIRMATLTEPPLTTVRQRSVTQGRAMVRMLLTLTRPGLVLPTDADLPDDDGTGRIVLPVTLVVRESA